MVDVSKCSVLLILKSGKVSSKKPNKNLRADSMTLIPNVRSSTWATTTSGKCDQNSRRRVSGPTSPQLPLSSVERLERARRTMISSVVDNILTPSPSGLSQDGKVYVGVCGLLIEL